MNFIWIDNQDILCCNSNDNMIYWNQEQKEIKKWLAIKSTMIYTR